MKDSDAKKYGCEHIWVKHPEGRKCIICQKIDRQYDLES